MRFVVIALVFACFCLIQHVTSEIHGRGRHYKNGCTSDKHCPDFCMCYKQSHTRLGFCACSMDPAATTVCSSNYQCAGFAAYRGHCWCQKHHHHSQHGSCKCQQPHKHRG